MRPQVGKNCVKDTKEEEEDRKAIQNVYMYGSGSVEYNLERNYAPFSHRSSSEAYCITLYFRGRKISRKVNLKYFREKIFSRIYCSRENIFPRKYLLAKIYSRENIFPRKYLPAKISSPDFVSSLGYSVYYSVTLYLDLSKSS